MAIKENIEKEVDEMLEKMQSRSLEVACEITSQVEKATRKKVKFELFDLIYKSVNSISKEGLAYGGILHYRALKKAGAQT